LEESKAKRAADERQLKEELARQRETIGQQNKLIEYLQARKEDSEDCKKKKGLGSLLASRSKGHAESHSSQASTPSVTVIPRQYKELTRMVEEERGRRMIAEQENDSLKRELAQAKGQQMPPAMHGTPVPSTPGARKVLKTMAFKAENSAAATPQRVSHNIPHKFLHLPVSAFTKKVTCARCEKSVGISQGGKELDREDPFHLFLPGLQFLQSDVVNTGVQSKQKLDQRFWRYNRFDTTIRMLSDFQNFL
jgi:hypothetical protein